MMTNPQIDIIKSLAGPIVLVGMPASGKTSLGQSLSHALGFSFIDTDRVIEAETGETIPALFKTRGEAGFRDIEAQIIRSIFETLPQGCVIATGGGAVLKPENRNILFGETFSIWVQAPVPVLLARVAEDSHRPLLRGQDAEKVLKELEAARSPFYCKADMTVDTSLSLPETLVPGIIAEISERIEMP